MIHWHIYILTSSWLTYVWCVIIRGPRERGKCSTTTARQPSSRYSQEVERRAGEAENKILNSKYKILNSKIQNKKILWRGDQELQNTKCKMQNTKIQNLNYKNTMERRAGGRKNILLFSKTFYSCASFQMASNATEFSTKIMNIPSHFCFSSEDF